MKGVNLNAFNEKLLHRYLLESLYGLVDDSTNIKRKLLPKSKHNMLKKINLIVPESNKAGVRPDLELFFKDSTCLPVEVKWNTKKIYSKNSENQLEYLQKNNGHLITLVNDADAPLGVTHSTIDFDHFIQWIAKRSVSLAKDTASEMGLTDGRQYWIATPKGSANSSTIENYNAMCSEVNQKDSEIWGKKTHFWAFKNHPINVKNHLKIRKGDRILFMMVNTLNLGLEKGHWLENEPNYPLNIFKWVDYEVKTSYFIELESELSIFFEDGNPAPGMRIYPHFIELQMIAEGGNFHLTKRGELSSQIRESAGPHRSGGPEPITEDQWSSMISILSAVH